MHIGQFQKLTVSRLTDPGAYLTDGENDVLLPTKYIPIGTKEGQKLNVFIYRDSEDRIICTTQTPHATVGQFAYLKVKDVSKVGAFLDWGIDKDLLIPFSEQKQKLRQGQWCLVYVLLDQKTDRLVATAKVARFFSAPSSLNTGDLVDLLITNETDLGINVVVENKFKGLIYQNDLFHDVMEGDRIKGYVKAIREDGKLDISLRKVGMKNLEVGAQQILDELRKNNGYLALHDKSDPDEIQSSLQMSKKNFKRSVGILYKSKIITLEEKGIRLK